MKMPLRLLFSQAICRILPPFLASQVRLLLYPFSLGKKYNLELTIPSQTGSQITVRTSEGQGYFFSAHGYNEWRNLAIARALTSPNDTIIEIGACIGTDTVGFSDIVGPEGKVHIFEPALPNILMLKQLIKSVKNKNIILHTYAVCNKDTMSQFLVTLGTNAGTGHLVHEHEGSQKNTMQVQVKCVRLDSMSDTLGKAKVIFIDTEGYDALVLRGAKTYIKQNKPAIVLEVSPSLISRSGYNLNDLLNEIKDLDYIPYLLNKFGVSEVQFFNFSETHNCICFHASQKELVKRVRKFILICGILPCIPGINPLIRK